MTSFRWWGRPDPIRIACLWILIGALGYGQSATANGQDWPRFRGPDGSGVIREAGLGAWPEGDPQAIWRQPLGEGFSQIVVAGDLLYALYAVGDEEFAGGFRVSDGSLVWKRLIGEKFVEEWGNGPRATPTVDGGTLYVLAAKGRLFALNAADGQVAWEMDLTEAYHIDRPPPNIASVLPPGEEEETTEFYGYSSSPLVVGDLLVVYTGAGSGRSLVGLDKRTGKELWTVFDHLIGTSSPISGSMNDRAQIITMMFHELVSVSDAGEILWRYPWQPTFTQPLLVAPDKVLISTSFDIGALLLKVDGEGAAAQVEPAWDYRLLRNTYSSPIFYDGHIYGFDNATLRCVSAASGEMMWAKRGLGKGTLSIADGKLVLLSDRGTLALAEASPDAYQELGRAKVIDGPSWTAPTPAQGRIFLRNHQEMVCLDFRGPSPS